nr:hypothetical protein [Tanacetum cinerariifolium]
MTTEGTQRNQEREKSSHRKLKQKRMEKSSHRNIKQKLGESKAKADGDCGLSKANEHTVVSGGVRGALTSMAPEPFRGKSRFVTDKMEQKQENNSVCDRLPPLSAKYPWFVAQSLKAKDEGDIDDKIFYTIHEPLSQYRCQIPELRWKRIRACFHGWVILSDYPQNVMWSLWNPNTSKLIHLPRLKNKLRYFHECCLSISPDDPRSIFLLTTKKKLTIVFCRLDCKRKKLRWTEMSYAEEFRSLTNGIDGSLDNLTCCNGKVYALSSAENQVSHVIEVDIVVTDKQAVINLLKIVEIPHACFNKCPRWILYPGVNIFLKGSCTDLFCIAIGYEDETMGTVSDMYLFKLNMAGMMWEEMKDLKDAIFFINICSGEVSMIYRQEIASEFGGYIHILNKIGTVIYSYNINYRNALHLLYANKSSVSIAVVGGGVTVVVVVVESSFVSLRFRGGDIPFNTLSQMVKSIFHLLDLSSRTVLLYQKLLEFNPAFAMLAACASRAMVILSGTSSAENQVSHVIEVDIVVTDKQAVINLLKIVEIPHACFNKCPRWILYPGVNIFLKGSCTDLFCIAIGYEDETMGTVSDMYLFKLNMAGMMWEEMKDLKDAIFFINICSGEVSMIYRQEIASEFGGYIHILNKIGTVIYSYNINYRTLSISSMQTSLVSALVMLECRLEGDHHADFEQQEDERDNGILVSSVEDHASQTNDLVDESHLLNIPNDMLETIMGHCVGVEYMKFRATCNRCRSVAPPIQWSNKGVLNRLQTYSVVSPWLIVLDKNQGIITFTDPVLGDNYFIKTPQQLIGSQIYCSRYGWLLMYKTDGALVFFNPFTNDMRELPHVNFLDSCCFSAPPTSPDCMVVGFSLMEELYICVHFLAGEPSWQIINRNPYDYRFPTFCGGDLYVLCGKHFFRQTSNDKGIHVFRNLGQEDYFWESVTNEAPTQARRFLANLGQEDSVTNEAPTQAKHFLAKCVKHCFLVVMGEFGKSIEVFNLNDSSNKWENVDGLGKHMIYISGSTCLCIEAKAPHMENKIYFPRLHSGKIVFYSLETRRYHTFNGKMVEKSFVDLTKTEYHTNPHVWIEPRENLALWGNGGGDLKGRRDHYGVGEELEGLEIEFSSSFMRVVGNGNEISFWIDRWVGGVMLCDRFSRLYHLDRRKEGRVVEKKEMG